MRIFAVGAVVATSFGLAGLAIAAETSGALHLFDEADLFTADVKKQAEKRFAGTKFEGGLHLNVSTYKEMPAEWKKKFDDASDKNKLTVVTDWAKSVATNDKAKGPFVLICLRPGYTVVLVDEETDNRGFSRAKKEELRKILDTGLKDAAKKDGDERTKLRDAALLKAIDYVSTELKGTKPKTSKEKP
jgi:hypothetical protein